jgi:hypothetical protein
MTRNDYKHGALSWKEMKVGVGEHGVITKHLEWKRAKVEDVAE